MTTYDQPLEYNAAEGYTGGAIEYGCGYNSQIAYNSAFGYNTPVCSITPPEEIDQSGGIWNEQVAAVRRMVREQAATIKQQQQLEQVVAEAVSEQVDRVEATEDARRLAALFAGTGTAYIPQELESSPVVSFSIQPPSVDLVSTNDETRASQDGISARVYLEKQRKRNHAALAMILALTETLH